MNDLDIVAVWIEHPCRIVARIVFRTSLRRFLALASGGHSRSVERIYLGMVLRYKSNMHRLGIRLSFSLASAVWRRSRRHWQNHHAELRPARRRRSGFTLVAGPHWHAPPLD